MVKMYKTIQEFLAALHIGLTWKNSDLKLITKKDYSGSHQFDLVIMYLSGLLGNPQGYRLLHALDPKLTKDKLSKRLDNLFSRIVKEYQGRWAAFLNRFFRGDRAQDASKLMRLWVVRCVAEGNAKHLVKKVDSLVLESGNLDLRKMPGGLHPQHMPAIAFYLHQSQVVTSLRSD